MRLNAYTITDVTQIRNSRQWSSLPHLSWQITRRQGTTHQILHSGTEYRHNVTLFRCNNERRYNLVWYFPTESVDNKYLLISMSCGNKTLFVPTIISVTSPTSWTNHPKINSYVVQRVYNCILFVPTEGSRGWSRYTSFSGRIKFWTNFNRHVLHGEVMLILFPTRKVCPKGYYITLLL
jgi:hypothetical protein